MALGYATVIFVYTYLCCNNGDKYLWGENP